VRIEQASKLIEKMNAALRTLGADAIGQEQAGDGQNGTPMNDGIP
jgi:hypothetical protein